MIDSIFDYLFDASSFMPHGVCLAWRPDLIALHALSDLGIVIAYASIPIALLYFLYRRTDLQFRFIFGLFALFILACGTSHAFGILTLWFPLYGLQGMVKFVTAIVSITTAVMIWPIIPKALALPSPSQLRQANDELIKEIKLRAKIEEELRRSHDDLGRLVHERTLELKQSEQRFRDFAEVSADWFWELDEDVRFKYVSVSNAEVTGLLPEDLIGKTWRESGISGVSEEEFSAQETVLDQHQPFKDFRFHRFAKNGKPIHISITGKPIFSPDGTFMGYRGSGRNITRLVEAENQIIDERDKATKASNAKSTFLANMSHEFRTPLNGIIGFSELMTTEAGKNFDKPKIQEIISDIHTASNHLLSLINNVLDLSRIEANMEVPQPQAIEFDTIINQCLDVTRAIAEKKAITLGYKHAANLPQICFDPTHLKQVLINILSNGIKYSGQNGHVEISAEAGPGSFVTVQIKDNGVGISDMDITRIFDAFERVSNNPMTSSEGGSGLGLSLARRLIELNGGSISLTSKKGQGSTVTMTLPSLGTNLIATAAL